jgi:D-xylose transport system substrate-binding protein
MINGTHTEPNDAEFKAGAHSAIDGKLKIGKEYDTPNWDPNNANQEAAAAITALGAQNVVGVYSANDGLAAGIGTALKVANLSLPLTGQDAQIDAVQRILAGTQTMSIYKPYKPEADTAGTMAVDLATGAALTASVAPTTATSGSGTTVKSDLVSPVVLTRDNIKTTVVADGLYTVTQICGPDFAGYCTAAGLQ